MNLGLINYSKGLGIGVSLGVLVSIIGFFPNILLIAGAVTFIAMILLEAKIA